MELMDEAPVRLGRQQAIDDWSLTLNTSWAFPLLFSATAKPDTKNGISSPLGVVSGMENEKTRVTIGGAVCRR